MYKYVGVHRGQLGALTLTVDTIPSVHAQIRYIVVASKNWRVLNLEITRKTSKIMCVCSWFFNSVCNYLICCYKCTGSTDKMAFTHSCTHTCMHYNVHNKYTHMYVNTHTWICISYAPQSPSDNYFVGP